MSNTITAFFKGRVGVSEAVYQNDYGIVMNFDSIELPAHFDCYFSVMGENEAIPGIGADRQVVIPNSCLSRSGTVTLHIPIHTGTNDSEVEYIVHFKVIGRARPVDDGTPVQMTAIEQALALLQNPIGNIEQIVNEALAFTGDTFAEMQAQLDADQAAFKTEVRGDIADVESDFDNLNAQYQTAVAALTVDSEIQNVRVGADNVTYASAGEAVRTQFTNLKSETTQIYDDAYNVTPIEYTGFDMDRALTAGGKDVVSGSTILSFPVTAGEIIKVDLTNRTGGNILFFFQDTQTVPWDSNTHIIGGIHSGSSYTGYLYVPSGATYLVTNADMSNVVSTVESVDSSVLTNLKNDFDSFKEHIDGQLPNPIFENGDIYIPNGSGIPEYSGSSTRLRTKRETSFYLEAGTVISLSDYTNWRYSLIKANGDNTYTGIGWLQRDYVIPSSANYLMQITKVPESAISPQEVNGSDLLIIRRGTSYTDVVNIVADSKAKLNRIYGTETARFELGDLYVDGSGDGAYYDSNSRIRTIANQPIALYAGDIVSLSDSSNAQYICRRKIAEGKYTVRDWTQQSTLISEDGLYEILIRYVPESTISNVELLANLFQITRHFSIIKETSNISDLDDVYDEELRTTINSAYQKTTSRGLMFGIVTDTHLENGNVSFYDQSMENLERLNDGLHFNGILHLGDIINGWGTLDEAKYNLQYAAERLLKIGNEKTYIVAGNHDNNAGGGVRLDDSGLYSYIQRFNEQYTHRSLPTTDSVYESPSSNYYVDYNDLKIRMIVFDSTYYSVGFSETMMDWISDVFLSAPSDYHFVLFTHASTEARLNGGNPIGNASIFKALLAQFKDRIYCYIHGHSHYDYVGYDNEFAQIALCCTVPNHTIQPSDITPGGIQPSRTIGTVTQDCISIIIILPEEQKVELIRFGAGSDRTIPFRQ